MPAATQLTKAQLQALQNALRKYAGQVSEKKLGEILSKIKGSLEDLLNPRQAARDGGVTATEGLNPATARNVITKILEDNGVEAIADQIDFTVKIANEVAEGAGNFVRANDQDVVDAFPAWELLRVYDREVPRGMRRGPKGGLVPDPGQDWGTRFVAACKEAGDEKALACFQATGRMIALKDSGVWQALGDGAGGYNDTLGNAYAPFAFNSGYDVDEVDYQECVELGFLKQGEKPKAAKFDLASLFSDLEDAA